MLKSASITDAYVRYFQRRLSFLLFWINSLIRRCARYKERVNACVH